MNKYNAQKIVVDGMTFDSKKEFKRWQELKLLQRAGEITDLQRQVSYVIVPKCKYIDGTVQRERKYIADFVYKEKGLTVVEDVKGYKKGLAYQMFTLKAALMNFWYGVKVKEI